MIKKRNILLSGLKSSNPIKGKKIISAIRVNRLAKVLGLIPGKIFVGQRVKKVNNIMVKKSPQEQEVIRSMELNRSIKSRKKRK